MVSGVFGFLTRSSTSECLNRSMSSWPLQNVRNESVSMAFNCSWNELSICFAPFKSSASPPFSRSASQLSKWFLT